MLLLNNAHAPKLITINNDHKANINYSDINDANDVTNDANDINDDINDADINGHKPKIINIININYVHISFITTQLAHKLKQTVNTFN